MAKSRPPVSCRVPAAYGRLVHAGRTPAELAREFGCTTQSIVNWVGQTAADSGQRASAAGATPHAARSLSSAGVGGHVRRNAHERSRTRPSWPICASTIFATKPPHA